MSVEHDATKRQAETLTPLITTQLAEDGILIATVDMPGRSMNVFSAALMDALDTLLEAVTLRDDVRSVVITSGKPAFVAGADLEMVRGFTEHAVHTSAEALHQLCGRLGRLFRRLETCRKPFVAAIHGATLGAGLELALACHARVATIDAQTRLGLPEVKLGLLPGAGGTQRLPRLADVIAALEMLLLGNAVSSTRAQELGIVDEVVAKSDLVARAKAVASGLTRTGAAAPWDRPNWHPATVLAEFSEHNPCYAIARRFGITDEQFEHYPAFGAIADCVLGGWGLPMDAACNWEMECFVRLIRSPVAGNMVRSLFLDRQRATKLFGGPHRAVPLEVAIEGPMAEPVAEVFRNSGVTVVEREHLSPAGLLIVTGAEGCSGEGSAEPVAWLRGAPNPIAQLGAKLGVWLSDTTEHGRALEVCVPKGNGAVAQPGIELARVLRATPMVSHGLSLLASLAYANSAASELLPDDRLLAVALFAARAWSVGAIPDTGIADSAAVIAGLYPAYAGGPFTYLRQCGRQATETRAREGQARFAGLFALTPGIDELFSTTARSG